jgi:ribulose-5-phosphate 4-epimerase/fuculose-1-phosphate aldolase
MNVSPPDPGLVEKLVLANRILYEQGIVDGLGHVSVRHASAPDTFLLSCNRAPGLVQPRDIVCYDATGNRLRPIYHMAGFLGSGSTTFDIRDKFGNTDMLIRNAELGKALAQSLDQCACVLMRGHGSTVVGNSIEQVVFRAIYAETNAKLQAQALGIGDVTFLTPEEADLAAAANDGQIPRSWDLWRRRIGPIDND